ncbi:hypothetical protein PPBDW_II1183 [Photobacterium kishitanii]|nr:hypothetical protein PPBDW_II1183 [Photobacterium kishitanii]
MALIVILIYRLNKLKCPYIDIFRLYIDILLLYKPYIMPSYQTLQQTINHMKTLNI